MRATPILAAAATLALTACHPHDVREADTLQGGPVTVPEQFAADAAEGAVKPPARWWQAFGDPGLDALMSAVLAQNLDLHRAWARLQQARAIAKGADAALWPNVDASASVGAQRNFNKFNPRTGEQEANIDTPTSVGLAASYELDVWGKASAKAKAAGLDVVATRLDLEALAMTLTGQVTETWYQLVEQLAQLKLLDEQIEINQTQLDLVRARFGRGLATAVDVYQQQQLLESTRAQRPLLEARIRVLSHQLAVLAGRPPERAGLAESAPGALPEPPPPPALGLPSELLRARPDVRAAQLRVEAADHRVGAAIAERYPSFRISLTTAFRAASFSDLIDRWVWELTGNVLAPLFDGDRREAEIDRNRGVVKEALAGLGQTFLRALQEVDDAGVNLTRQRAHVEALEAQLAVSQQLVDQSRLRYAAGLSDYLPVLNALIALQQVERQILSARRQLISYQVQLARALGGDWTGELAPPGDDQDRAATARR